jgi:hypothetical protein
VLLCLLLLLLLHAPLPRLLPSGLQLPLPLLFSCPLFPLFPHALLKRLRRLEPLLLLLCR